MTTSPSGQAQTAGRPALLTREQRHAAGKALRATVSRESLAALRFEKGRDPLPILQASDAGRVSNLVPERYRRMGASPFAFYRGAAALMAADLAHAPRIGLPVQACGDCHLMNFGAFSSPEGNVLFDINDFDETSPNVDFIVDLQRLAGSVAVAAEAAGMTEKKAYALTASTVAAYRDFMSFLAEEDPLAVWRTRMTLDDQVKGFGDDDLETKVLETLSKAEKKGKASSEQPIVFTGPDGHPRFIDKAPNLFHVGADGVPVSDVVTPALIEGYRATLLPERAMLLDRYRLVDAAFKVVGVGSVGTFCAVALMATSDGETLILQIKQAGDAAVAALAPAVAQPAPAGRRVVDGQRALQAASDIFLGWTSDASGRQFYVRQLKNRRLGSLGELIEGKALPAYAALCGRTLARAHARTGDAATIDGYIGGSDALDEALAEFAVAYARQTVLDHARLVGSGLVPQAAVPVAKAA